MKIIIANFFARLGRFFFRHRSKFKLLGLIILLVLVAIIYPKAKYRYDTSINLPVHLSAQEKQQFLERYREILNDRESFGKNHTGLYNNIGILRSGMGDYKGAIKSFKLAQKRNPQDARFYRNAGIAYTYLEKYDAAEKEFLRAFSIAPTHPEYWLELGELYIYKFRDNPKARLFYLDALSRSQNHLSVAQNFANFLENVEKDYAESIKYWQIVADKAGEGKVAFLTHIAELKLRAGLK